MRWFGKKDSSTSRNDAGFDPATSDWTDVRAPFYFFEPWCGEFTPPGPGSVVVALGVGKDRHRGLHVDVWDDGKGVSLWPPSGARTFWLPDAAPDDHSAPWKTRLRELDSFTGTLAGEG